jgi:release factor H-coupled RctB family protein
VRLAITRGRPPALDRLERRLRAAIEAGSPPCAEAPEAIPALLRRGAAGLADLAALPGTLRRLAAAEAEAPAMDASALPPATVQPLLAASLGTVGGGNHFAEVSVVDEVLRPDLARDLGIARGRLAVLVHSGSRGLGRLLADQLAASCLRPDEIAGYLAAQAWACRFAAANRLLIAGALMAAAEAARPDQVVATVDVVHNQVEAIPLGGRTAWLHRKGAAPARARELTVVLGSRGAPSFLMRGTGSVDGLWSVAHGAGRRLTRAEALDKLRARYRRESLQRTALHGRVIGGRTELLYEEHPDAYKPIRPVVDALVEAGLAEAVATLRPLVTVKP